MRTFFVQLLVALLAVAHVAPASAAEIIYTYKGEAVGVLGQEVLNGEFTLTGVGDTDNVILNSPLSPTSTIVPLSSFTISFGGNDFIGLVPTFFIVNPPFNFAAFNAFYPPATVRSVAGFDLVGFDGLSNFGPVTPSFTATNFTIDQPAPNTYATTGGDLIFTGPITPVSFEASVAASVPEPSTWALMLLGFLAIGTMLRRSRQRDQIAVSVA